MIPTTDIHNTGGDSQIHNLFMFFLKQQLFEEHVSIVRFAQALCIKLFQELFLVRFFGSCKSHISIQQQEIMIAAEKQISCLTEVNTKNNKKNHEAKESPGFNSEISEIKKRKPREKKNRPKNLVFGRWSVAETLAYVRFLEENYNEFKQGGGQSRRLKKTFIRMARDIGTRNSDQCRSHHQKMLNFRKTIPQIISQFKDQYSQLVDWNIPHNYRVNATDCPQHYSTQGCPEPHPFTVTVMEYCIRIEILESFIKVYNPFEHP